MARQEKEQVQQPSLPRPGSPIPPPLRHQLEVTFRADLSNVRIHSAHNASALGAVAYTHGDDIHFKPGVYQPYSPGGHELLAHELTHVVQQRAVGQVPTPHHTFRSGSENPAGE
jgi:hypothetical protein